MRKPIPHRTAKLKVPKVKRLVVKEGTVVEVVGPVNVPLAILPAARVDMVKIVAPIPEQGFWSWLLFGPDHPKTK